MDPMQMIMAGINAMTGGGKDFNNSNRYNSNNRYAKGGTKGGSDSEKMCYNRGKAGHMDRDRPYLDKESGEWYNCDKTGQRTAECQSARSGSPMWKK